MVQVCMPRIKINRNISKGRFNKFECELCGDLLKSPGKLCSICGGEFYALKRQKRYKDLPKEELFKIAKSNMEERRRKKYIITDM